ncbi:MULTISPECIES: hypothetical protein [Streptomyces]|uniref:hypothetical protein n=1 Tax=Streptomyces TaxID=1883 RepID=UPI000E680D16|nr:MULTISPECIES: hypothetical protein [Streptomyces]MDX3066747.1 hypothetical protein [Streptomyces sp. ND04-05B]MDX3519559.1 hypothetical protein [Streptomyces scabiei]
MTFPSLRLAYNPRAIEPTDKNLSLVPYITQRAGEDAAPDNLIITRHPAGPRLYYADEDPRDRDPRGALWARCGWNPVDAQGRITGEPQWKLIHPHRQMVCMQTMLCQVCTRPARTPLGFIFLAGPRDYDPSQPSILTNQPPVCRRHARAAARLCKHLENDPIVFLARSAPLYGVHGTLYGRDGRGSVKVVAQPEAPLPYGHPNIGTFLASQLVRRLQSFRVVGLPELLEELATPAA